MYKKKGFVMLTLPAIFFLLLVVMFVLRVGSHMPTGEDNFIGAHAAAIQRASLYEHNIQTWMDIEFKLAMEEKEYEFIGMLTPLCGQVNYPIYKSKDCAYQPSTQGYEQHIKSAFEEVSERRIIKKLKELGIRDTPSAMYDKSTGTYVILLKTLAPIPILNWAEEQEDKRHKFFVHYEEEFGQLYVATEFETTQTITPQDIQAPAQYASKLFTQCYENENVTKCVQEEGNKLPGLDIGCKSSELYFYYFIKDYANQTECSKKFNTTYPINIEKGKVITFYDKTKEIIPIDYQGTKSSSSQFTIEPIIINKTQKYKITTEKKDIIQNTLFLNIEKTDNPKYTITAQPKYDKCKEPKKDIYDFCYKIGHDDPNKVPLMGELTIPFAINFSNATITSVPSIPTP